MPEFSTLNNEKIMKKLNISPAIQPQRLSGTERDQLTNSLYEVHCQIFDGVDKETFRSYVIEPDTVTTRIFLIQTDQKETVGYLTFQVYQPEVLRKGKIKRPYVFRTEIGIRQEYRGRANYNRVLFREALKFCLRKGMPEAYYMATPINPLAYFLACRSIDCIYPQPHLATPAKILSVMNELSATLTTPASGQAHKVGWIAQMPPAQERRMRRSDNPWFQFFIRHNPDFHKGYGMMWLAPATPGNALRTGIKILKQHMKRPRFKRIQLSKLIFSPNKY